MANECRRGASGHRTLNTARDRRVGPKPNSVVASFNGHLRISCTDRVPISEKVRLKIAVNGHFRVIGICAGRSRPANRVPCMQRCRLSCSRTHGVSFLSSDLPRALCELHAELKPGGFVRFEPAVIMKKAGTPSAMHLSRPRDLGVAMRRQLAWSNLPRLLIVIEPNLQCDFSPCG